MLRAAAPRVLVVRLSAVGDVLHALPAVAALRDFRPSARIDWIVEDRAADLLRGSPLLDRVHVFPRRRWSRSLPRPWLWPSTLVEALRLAGSLLAARYDAALDLQGNLKSAVWTALSGAPLRVGLPREEAKEGSAAATNARVAPEAGRSAHRVERAASMVSALVGERLRPRLAPLPRPEAAVASVDAAVRAAGLPERGFAVLHPGTSGFGAFKRWPAERFAALARRVVEEARVPVAVTGAPEGDDEALAAAVRAGAGVPVARLATGDLAGLAEVLRRASVVVAADTGALHLAAAVGTPAVGLFGPKDAAVYGPWGAAAGGTFGPLPVVERRDVPCRPCPLRWCPDPVCMSGIGVDAVYGAVRSALGRG
jgi:lipopolysaccharide heptosyltransferase I